MKINIGTRGSALARLQAQELEQKLLLAHPGVDIETKIIASTGDNNPSKEFSHMGQVGVFTKELDAALLRKEIDVAVHSAKDMPSTFLEGLMLGGVSSRVDGRDVLLSIEGDTLESEKPLRIGTSSVRRRALLQRYAEQVTLVPMRGNVDTRLAKMQAGSCDAIVLSAAGVERLQMSDKVNQFLDPSVYLPSPCQGTVAYVAHRDNKALQEVLSKCSDAEEEILVRAQRGFLAMLNGGCQVPVGVWATCNNDIVAFVGAVWSLDGKVEIKRTATCSLKEAIDVAKKLGKEILNAGGKAVLEGIVR